MTSVLKSNAPPLNARRTLTRFVATVFRFALVSHVAQNVLIAAVAAAGGVFYSSFVGKHTKMPIHTHTQTHVIKC